jgi:hypothetical protein
MGAEAPPEDEEDDVPVGLDAGGPGTHVLDLDFFNALTAVVRERSARVGASMRRLTGWAADGERKVICGLRRLVDVA